MKILPIEKIREADAYTIQNEPIPDIDLMERAATELFEWIAAKLNPQQNIKIYCGLGNNGGDGFVLGRLLANAGYKVELIVLWYANKMSPSCETNFKRAKNIKTITITELQKSDPIPEISPDELIVDAIFGSGLTRPVEGFLANVIESINKSKAVVVAIDAPSGFFCDVSNTDNKGAIIKADYTLTFQFPKLGFLFPENDQYVGEWEVLHIGLHPDFINEVEVKNFYLISNDLKQLIGTRTKFSHKGNYGHGLLISGGYGKMGAAVLAAKSALKSGAGLITTHIPKSGNIIMQTAVPSAMTSIDNDEWVFSQLPDLSNYSAVAIGPGIGTDQKTQNALKLLIQNVKSPLILDADAINILGENKTWIPFITRDSIFTPHPKEFERLTGKSKNDFNRNQKQREFSIKYGVYVVLKGAHTAITCPDGNCYFNSTGNPGMATGGSGDVLTGIILGLKAQGYSSKTAALLGVYIHGLAGDIAAEKWGYISLTAGNISHNIGKAFKKLTNTY
jgi:NAD(P)H-hydrate epimerase